MRVFNPETISQQLNQSAQNFLGEEVSAIEDKKKVSFFLLTHSKFFELI